MIPDRSATFPGPSYPLHASRHPAAHLTWMRLRGLSDRTLLCRRRAVAMLAEHLGHDPAEATHDELYGYQQHLRATSAAHLRWHTSLLRPFYRWLVAAGHRLDDPAALLPSSRARRALPRPMAEAKVMAAVEAASARVRPWLLLAGWCGLRAAEIAHLRVDDFHVDAHDGRVFLRVVGKGDRVRDVAVPQWVWADIVAGLPETGRAWRRQRRSRGELGVVMPNHVSKVCNAYLRSVGITDTLHTLRHASAPSRWRSAATTWRWCRTPWATPTRAPPASTPTSTRAG
ncbi:MAG: tyrosine-type recombinase/integrase [Pseudonocardia sp.]